MCCSSRENIDNIPRKPAPNEYWEGSHWHLVYPLSSYKRLHMCHSLITLAASRTEIQIQWPVLYCRDAGGLEEPHMATHLLRLWSTGWWILFDIQNGSHLLVFAGCSINCGSFFDTKQINFNLSGQLHLYVAHFCVTGHIHTMVTGGLLALKHNTYSSTATRRNTRGIKPWHRRE